MPASPSKILVIRRDNIGDLVCTTPLLAHLRELYPSSELMVLGNSYNIDVLQGNSDVDGVYYYTKSKHRRDASLLSVYWHRFKTLRKLRGKGIDLAILATPAVDRHGCKLARQVGARRITGVDDGSLGLDEAVSLAALKGLHQVEQVFVAAGMAAQVQQPLRVVVSEQERAWALAQLGDVDHSRGLLGVHISARKPCNRWPIEHYAKMVRLAYEQTRLPVLLFWSPGAKNDPAHPGDDEDAEQLKALLEGVPLVAFRTEKLRELAAGLSLLKALVCSDGGAMHLASGVGCPVACFFGYDGATQWRPWGKHALLYADPLSDISPEQVVTALQGLL